MARFAAGSARWVTTAFVWLVSVPASGQALNGTYNGLTHQGRTISVTVSNGNITSYTLSYACAGSGSTTVNTSCAVTNGNFTCGSATCIPAPGVLQTQISGRFNGNHVSGRVAIALGGNGFCACQVSGLPFNADIAGTEGTTIVGPNGTGLCAATSRPSQFFTDRDSAAELADDFVVPAPQRFTISRVWAFGAYGSGAGPVDGIDIKIFADAAGNPGAVQCGYTGLLPLGRTIDADFVVDLPMPCALDAGTYWLSVQGRMPFNPLGQWFWTEVPGSAGSGYRFQDPANVLGTPCATWGSGAACFDPDPTNANTCFLLKGGAGIATSTNITGDGIDPSVVGQTYSVAVTVSSSGGTPPGSVMVTDGSGGACMAPLSGGNGSCDLVSSSAGTKQLTASYAEQGGFSASADTEAHRVDAAATALAIDSDAPDPSGAGQAVEVGFTLSVIAPGSGTPTGNVTVSASGSESCVATLPTTSCTLALTSEGMRMLTASFPGDGNFGASMDGEPHVVLGDSVFADGFETP